MKNQLIHRIGMLILFAFTFSLSSIADNINCEQQQQFSQDIFITINNDSRIHENSIIRIKLEFTANSNVSSLIISDYKNPSDLDPFEDKVPNERTGQLKDGKVDVDIIIRGSDLSIYRDPSFSKDYIKINVLTFDFITVDNISGVYETEGSTSNESFAYRIVSTEISNENEVNNTITNVEGIFSIGLSNIKYSTSNSSGNLNVESFTSNDITLYPTPVRNSTFRVKANIEVGDFKNISVFNVVGGLVHQESLKNLIISDHQFNLPQLPSGVYFLNLETTKGRIVKKFNLIN